MQLYYLSICTKFSVLTYYREDLLVLRYHGCGFEYQLARALKERQCTLEGQARYVNVRGSVHWKGVYRVGDRDLGVRSP